MVMSNQVCSMYLLRHGRTESNTAGRLMGQVDEPLADAGKRQAAAAAPYLVARGIKAIYASDLARASETAAIVGHSLGLSVTGDAGLREINMGDWAGKTYEEVRQTDEAAYEAFRANPESNPPTNGETERQMASRVWRALTAIATRHQGSAVLVVSHGGPLRSIAARVLGLPHLNSSIFAVDNCGILLLEWSGDAVRLVVPGPVIG